MPSPVVPPAVRSPTSEVRSTTSTDGTVNVEGERGSARLTRLAPGVTFFLCRGYFPTTYAAPMIAMADREIRVTKKLVMAVDAWELSSVESGFREAWTVWFKAHKRDVQMELLIKSKLMEMAASLANLFTGAKIVSTHSRVEEWERAVAKAVPGFRRPAY